MTRGNVRVERNSTNQHDTMSQSGGGRDKDIHMCMDKIWSLIKNINYKGFKIKYWKNI